MESIRTKCLFLTWSFWISLFRPVYSYDSIEIAAVVFVVRLPTVVASFVLAVVGVSMLLVLALGTSFLVVELSAVAVFVFGKGVRVGGSAGPPFCLTSGCHLWRHRCRGSSQLRATAPQSSNACFHDCFRAVSVRLDTCQSTTTTGTGPVCSTATYLCPSLLFRLEVRGFVRLCSSFLPFCNPVLRHLALSPPLRSPLAPH